MFNSEIRISNIFNSKKKIIFSFIDFLLSLGQVKDKLNVVYFQSFLLVWNISIKKNWFTKCICYVHFFKKYEDNNIILILVSTQKINYTHNFKNKYYLSNRFFVYIFFQKILRKKWVFKNLNEKILQFEKKKWYLVYVRISM